MQLSWVAPSGKEIDSALWPGCKTVGCVVSQRVVGDKVAELEERYGISSRVLTAQELARTEVAPTEALRACATSVPDYVLSWAAHERPSVMQAKEASCLCDTPLADRKMHDIDACGHTPN